MVTKRYTLWGTPHSLFTGKVRSYLIKKQAPFDEVPASDPRFLSEVIAQVGHMVIPVVETPDGTLLQDSTAIIEHCEAVLDGPSFQPEGPTQNVIAQIIDAFGSNYLTPLAMHYRWTYRDRQDLFLQAEFARAIPTSIPYENRLATAAMLMEKFAGFLPNLGVTSITIPAMEDSYRELLAALETHFRAHPYLLGGRPSVADFGL
ncbi:MAG: hypothetical protein RIQ99_2120, partial [Pseudomonadota bacterium]